MVASNCMWLQSRFTLEYEHDAVYTASPQREVAKMIVAAAGDGVLHERYYRGCTTLMHAAASFPAGVTAFHSLQKLISMR